MDNKEAIEEKVRAVMEHSICRRAALMHLVLTGYALFESIQTLKKRPHINITYTDAEELADIFSEVVSFDVTPSMFLHDKNEIANKLLDDYAKYKALLNGSFDEMVRSSVESYYHHLYYYYKLDLFKFQPVLIGVTAFLNYASGLIDKAELKRNIIGTDPVRMKNTEIDSKYLRYNLMTLEKDFFDICIKKANRKNRDLGQITNVSFTLDIDTN